MSAFISLLYFCLIQHAFPSILIRKRACLSHICRLSPACHRGMNKKCTQIPVCVCKLALMCVCVPCLSWLMCIPSLQTVMNTSDSQLRTWSFPYYSMWKHSCTLRNNTDRSRKLYYLTPPLPQNHFLASLPVNAAIEFTIGSALCVYSQRHILLRS